MRAKSREAARRLRQAVVRRSPAGPSRAVLTFGGLAFPAALGRSGITSLKREGDGATPRGAMAVEFGFCRSDRLTPPATRLRLIATRRDIGWCDAPDHPLYNRPVRLPFAASHETMMRADRLYDVCVVLDWNRRPRRRHAGSAIFLHIAKPGFQPTEGCIAVSPAAMRRLLPFLREGLRIVVR